MKQAYENQTTAPADLLLPTMDYFTSFLSMFQRNSFELVLEYKLCSFEIVFHLNVLEFKF